MQEYHNHTSSALLCRTLISRRKGVLDTEKSRIISNNLKYLYISIIYQYEQVFAYLDFCLLQDVRGFSIYSQVQGFHRN